LGVDGQNGQQFGGNPRERGKGELSPHSAYSSRKARTKANARDKCRGRATDGGAISPEKGRLGAGFDTNFDRS
jgi:hypothetical protein